MSGRVRVPIWQQPRSFATIDPKATRGATVGTDVYNRDGTLFEPAAAATPAAGQASTVVIWRRVLEIPANVVALQLATGTGLFAVTGASTGAFRTLGDSTTITWSNGNGVAGNPVPSLADLADSGVGTFKLLTRDGKGRLSGTKDGTTSDVPEGTNLYFTEARAADAAPIQSVVAGTNVTIDTTDPANPIVSATGGGGGLTGGIIDGGNATTTYAGEPAFDFGSAT